MTQTFRPKMLSCLIGPICDTAPRIGSTDFSILKGYELWMDDGLGGLGVGR